LEGFVDGFRVTPQKHGQSLPSGSVTEKSSITSDNSSHGGGSINAFKEKAGFARTKSRQHQRSGTSMRPNTIAPRTSRVALQHHHQSLQPNRSKESIYFFDEMEANVIGMSEPGTSSNYHAMSEDYGNNAMDR